MEKENKVLKVYFAGDLFDAKDLGGNLLLAQAIEKISAGRYLILLPQDGECEVKERTAQSIRDEDFRLLLSCDVLVANFDGTDLDSGTVVEFCFAKMLDIPTVLLRTDFRDGGDAGLPDSPPWNLMASHFPRTEILHLNSMLMYHESRRESNIPAIIDHYYHSVAVKVVEALDQVTSEKGWLKPDELPSVFANTLKSISGNEVPIFSDSEIAEIIEGKMNSGLY